MNAKTTKRALFSSVLAIVLCLAMLIGTTFAWFTDTASTGVNKIVSGNLDVKLEYATAWNEDGSVKTWTDAEGQTLNFRTADGRTDNILWEPGCTYELPELRVVNNGNLALKFYISVNGVDGDAKLLKAIEWTMSAYDGMLTFPDLDSEVTKLLPGKNWEFKLSAHMKEEAGNEYMNETIEGIGITVVATQDTVENDSFDNTYDENATYPDSAYVTVSAPEEGGENTLAAAIADAATQTDGNGNQFTKITAALGAGEFTLSDAQNETKAATVGKEVTLIGSGADKTTYKVAQTQGEASADYAFDGAKSLVIKNMTLEFKSNTDFQGFIRAHSVRIENCTIIGMGASWGDGEVVFENCTFKHPSDANEYTYSLWTYAGTSFTFNNCTFEANNGKVINLYRQGVNEAVPVTFNKCTFKNTGNAIKAAVKINGDHIWNITINDCTTDGTFPSGNDGLWEIENAVAGTTITINGSQVYGN